MVRGDRHRTVPSPYAGSGRRVYPGFLQLGGFVAMNPRKHFRSHWDFYLDLVKGDDEDAEAHRKFYDEYNAVLDMPAEYYLDTIKTVFQEHALPRGVWHVNGTRVAPEDIRTVALLTVEGELDDISGSGQTQAAQDLVLRHPFEEQAPLHRARLRALRDLQRPTVARGHLPRAARVHPHARLGHEESRARRQQAGTGTRAHPPEDERSSPEDRGRSSGA